MADFNVKDFVTNIFNERANGKYAMRWEDIGTNGPNTDEAFSCFQEDCHDAVVTILTDDLDKNDALYAEVDGFFEQDSQTKTGKDGLPVLEVEYNPEAIKLFEALYEDYMNEYRVKNGPIDLKVRIIFFMDETHPFYKLVSNPNEPQMIERIVKWRKQMDPEKEKIKEIFLTEAGYGHIHDYNFEFEEV